MKPRRGSRLYWYQYHKNAAQSAAEDSVRAQFANRMSAKEKQINECRAKRDEALRSEPWISKLKSFLGIETPYWKSIVSPLERALDEKQREYWEIQEAKNRRVESARNSAVRFYEQRRAEGKEEAINRAERVAERKEARHIKYLERSGSLRSAARALRDRVLSRDSSPSGEMKCMYCGITLSKNTAHLEHKRPLARGGNNKMGNLGVACASCNLKKGRKTDEEFVRSRGLD